MDLNIDTVRETMRRVRKLWWKKRVVGGGELRAHPRYVMRRKVCVTPIELHDGAVRVLKTPRSYFVASTTDLSLRGIGFIHGQPLPTRHAILTFELPGEAPVSLVTQIQWTKRCTDRSYQSGGKFLAVIATPECLSGTNPPTSRLESPALQPCEDSA